MDFDPSSLNPDFAGKLDAFRTLLANQYGLSTDVGSATRDSDTQAQLYAQGRTAPGPIVTNAPAGSSYHNYGAAVDLVPKGMSEKDAAATIGRAFQENPDLGLTWGGSFKNIYDPFHVQLGVPLQQLRTQPNANGLLSANAVGQSRTPSLPLFAGSASPTSALPASAGDGSGSADSPPAPGAPAIPQLSQLSFLPAFRPRVNAGAPGRLPLFRRG